MDPSSATGAPEFSVARTDEQDGVVLALTGELDLASADLLLAQADDIATGTRLTLDLRDLTFMDSSGIRALMNLDARARERQWTLRLANPQSAVRRLLAMCALDGRIPVIDISA